MNSPSSHPDRIREAYDHGLTLIFAQKLYDHFISLGLDPREWIECLSNHIGGPTEQVRARIKRIIEMDKGIKLEGLEEKDRSELIREVAEWLAAERIIEQMRDYEGQINSGLENGSLREIESIEEVIAVKEQDLMIFESIDADEIRRLLCSNYVIKTGTVMGQGRRIRTYELIPKSFPFPRPKTDELHEGLLLKYPNRDLVVRLPQRQYVHLLGSEFNPSEERAVATLARAAETFTFKSDDEDKIPSCIRESLNASAYLSEQIAHRENGEKVFSFIPPLVIVVMRIKGEDELTRATVQKRIIPKGHLFSDDPTFEEDLKDIPGFAEKVEKFVDANKTFYEKEGRLPDLAGQENVLYTEKGNVYLVDVNNICAEPDYKMLALLVMLKQLNYQGADDQKKGFVRDAIRRHVESSGQYGRFKVDSLDEMAEKLYWYDEVKEASDFLVQCGFFDDMRFPVFPANVNKLHDLEKKLLSFKLVKGEINEREFKEALANLKSQKIYAVMYPSKKYEDKKGFMDAERALHDMQAGDETWVMDFAASFLKFYVRWTEQGGNID